MNSEVAVIEKDVLVANIILEIVDNLEKEVAYLKKRLEEENVIAK